MSYVEMARKGSTQATFIMKDTSIRLKEPEEDANCIRVKMLWPILYIDAKSSPKKQEETRKLNKSRKEQAFKTICIEYLKDHEPTR